MKHKHFIWGAVQVSYPCQTQDTPRTLLYACVPVVFLLLFFFKLKLYLWDTEGIQEQEELNALSQNNENVHALIVTVHLNIN